MRVKFGMLEQTQGAHLHAKFHLNVFIELASDNQKPNFGQILTFFGLLGLNLMCYSKPTAYAYMPNFISIGLFCRPLAAKNRNFCHILHYGI